MILSQQFFHPLGGAHLRKVVYGVVLGYVGTVPKYEQYISLNSERILVKFWILNLMTKPNKPYDTTPRIDPLNLGTIP